jgi:hypothetical protein
VAIAFVPNSSSAAAGLMVPPTPALGVGVLPVADVAAPAVELVPYELE